ncbi:MAG: PEGA domain-containing protein [Candidatus Marinimicrobia bacterium]|nr:PEGA domain-containing protein [Candidatus Neomarinimicrobiota bacterium]
MRKIFRRFAIFILVVCFYGLLPVQAQDKMNIAVIDFEAQGGLTPQEAAVLTNRLRSKLVATNVFIMLDRGRMDEILKEQGFQISGCTSTKCKVEMGSLLNVQKIVSGSIGKIGKLYTLEIALIDIVNAKVIKSLTRDYTGEIEGIIGLMGPIADELAGISKSVTTVSVETAPAESGVGVIKIVTVPTQAMVYIDGIKLGLTPFKSEELKAGEYTIKITKQGYLDHEQTFSVEAEQTNSLGISLKRMNSISINSKPKGAALYLNDELKGTTPFKSELPSGNYALKLTKVGYADWEQEIAINKDYSQNITLLKMFSISFSSRPSQAEIFMNNKYVGTTPITSEFAEGSYSAKIHLENFEDFEKFIKLKKDMQIKTKLKYTKEYRKQLAEMNKGKRFVKKSLLLGSVAAVIGGGVYYYMTQIAPSQDRGFPNPPGRP